MAHPAIDKEREAGMHRIGGARFWTALLPLVAVVSVLSVHGQTAAAAENSRGAGTALPVAGANAASIIPYLSAGVALACGRCHCAADAPEPPPCSTLVGNTTTRAAPVRDKSAIPSGHGRVAENIAADIL